MHFNLPHIWLLIVVALLKVSQKCFTYSEIKTYEADMSVLSYLLVLRSLRVSLIRVVMKGSNILFWIYNKTVWILRRFRGLKDSYISGMATFVLRCILLTFCAIIPSGITANLYDQNTLQQKRGSRQRSNMYQVSVLGLF